jgi:hypothetical protein
MNVSRYCFVVALALAFTAGGTARAVDLLQPGDFIIPIDLDIPPTYTGPEPSPYPAGEHPGLLFDGNAGTKYLNFGKEHSGFIVSPGPSLVQSVQFTSANDADARDPMTWQLYGTNASISSTDKSSGNLEPWVLIASGNTGLTPTRLQTVAPISFANSEAYSSYRMLFPSLRNAGGTNSMQIAGVQLFQEADGTVPVIAPGSAALGIDQSGQFSRSTNTGLENGNENASKAIDGVKGPSGNPFTKYLNFGQANSGFIVTPDALPTIVESFVITTANDASERDPASWALYGTNDPIVSTPHSLGSFENWTLIDSGAIDLPALRYADSAPILVNGADPYLSYRLVFPTVRNGTTANSMQIAEVQFQGQVVPEPSTWALAATGLMGLGLIRRKRKA